MSQDLDKYYLGMAAYISTRHTCIRRAVGCVLVDNIKHVLSTGYNGPPSGMSHCITTPCGGADYSSGEGLDKCEAVHAEQNALLQCSNVQAIHTAYSTTEPCIHCIKLLLNTSCQRLVFRDLYSNSDVIKVLWEQTGRQWIHMSSE
jgi:dCMP deaminase